MTASDDSVRLWNSQTGSLEHSFEHASGRLTRATLSPDGRRLATAANDGLVRIWDLETTALIHGFAADDNVIWGVGFSPDGRKIATASSDEIVALWDLATGRRLAALTGHMGGATDVAYLADGVTVVAVDRSGQLHWWDSETGRRLTDAWQAHAGASWRIAIHPDGQRFATSGDEGLVKFWDELSIPQACRTGRPGFDAVRRQQYLGEKERSLACE